MPDSVLGPALQGSPSAGGVAAVRRPVRGTHDREGKRCLRPLQAPGPGAMPTVGQHGTVSTLSYDLKKNFMLCC